MKRGCYRTLLQGQRDFMWQAHNFFRITDIIRTSADNVMNVMRQAIRHEVANG